jgi:hypothetical protein
MTACPPAKPSPNPDNAGPIVHRPMGLPITAGCDTSRDRTRVCSDTSVTDMQCLRPLCHSGGNGVMVTSTFKVTLEKLSVHVYVSFIYMYDFWTNEC